MPGIVHFEKNYFTFAYGQNYERRNPPYKWQAFLKELLKFRSGGDLLEAGCGFGLFLREASGIFHCSGCDISRFAVAQARRHLTLQVPLFCSDLVNVPLNRTYDVIVAFDVLEHVPDLDRAYHNLVHLLKPGGFLIFTVPVYDGPLGGLVERLDHDTTHVHKNGRDFWLQLIEPPMTLVHFTGVWRYFLLERYYLNRVSQFSRHWTTAILVIAQKSALFR